ncbi:MAG: hypothetical protein CVU41_16900 [Chloroflexi bacterium HGW-Chloroflexi-3]|nr:MAG: hypothetical protein CVU41_16900 [Chloroflexi bacterium HGW-Chloroflexi-3]
MMIDYSGDEFCQKFNPLPHGWHWYPLGECVEVLDHERIPINQKERNSRIEGKPLENLYPYYGATGQVGVIDDYIFNEELVLLGEDGAPFLDQGKPKAYLIKGKCWVNNHAHVLRPNPHLLFTPFLCNYLNLFDYSNYVTGTTRLKLNQSRMREIPVLIPPRNIQHNILTRLESIFTQTQIIHIAVERVPDLLKAFRQSVLAAAFRGELTERDPNDEPASVLLERIRGERRRRWGDGLRAKGKDSARAVYEEPLAPDTSKLPELPEGWVWTTLQMIADVRSGVTKGRDLSKFKTIEVPYLRVANVQAGYLDLREVKRISIKEDELDGYRLQVNDVLYTEGGDRDKLGRGTVWKGEVDPCIHQNHIFCARLYLPEVNPEWVSMTGQLEYARNYVDSVASQSVNLASINSTNLKAMPVPLPPKEEQLRIMEKVTALMQRVQVAEQAFVTASNQTSNLEQQILIKAFRGDLKNG